MSRFETTINEFFFYFFGIYSLWIYIEETILVCNIPSLLLQKKRNEPVINEEHD
jgi:hypothetical protein